MSNEDTEDRPQVGIWKALRTLPLCDEPYLAMQAMNLEVVDRMISRRRRTVLRRCGSALKNAEGDEPGRLQFSCSRRAGACG